MAAIDWHTSEMAKHWEMAKETQHMQRQFNNHLYKLLQETEYWQVVEVGESRDKESAGMETSDREIDEDVEGEEAPESDLEVPVCLFLSLHGGTKKTGGWKQNQESKARGSEGQRVAVSAGQSCGVLEETGVVVAAGVHEKERSRGPKKGKMPMRIRQMMTIATAYPINGWEQGSEQRLRAEEVQDENIGGRLEQDIEEDMEEQSWKVGFHKLPKGVNREASVGDHESKGHLFKEVWSVAKLESENQTGGKSASSHTSWKRKSLGESRVVTGEKKVGSTLGQASEVAMKTSLGEDN
ncbi:hypothetical protein EDC04DRAFT_2613447 [Pisolithus marmoratus]|nr:hypothetical protein EDC04DRAFT_2613447 [Pisolithus marmoratus]